MANAKQCDICKNFYAAIKRSRKLEPFQVQDTSAIVLYDLDEGQEELETCPECMKKIKVFINDMKGE